MMMPPSPPSNPMAAREFSSKSPLVSPSGSRRVVKGGGGRPARGQKVDFLTRQKEREQAKAARLEARRKAVPESMMSKPTCLPVTTGHDVMGRPVTSSGGSAAFKARPRERPQTRSDQSGFADRMSGGGAREMAVGDALSNLRLYVTHDKSERCSKALQSFCKAIPDGHLAGKSESGSTTKAARRRGLARMRGGLGAFACCASTPAKADHSPEPRGLCTR